MEEFIESIPFAKKAEAICYAECGLIAINKGSGIMAHPNPNAPMAAATAILKARYNFDKECFSWTDSDGQRRHLYLINRLDSPTSGVMFVSADEELAKAVKASFKERQAKKIYYAICGGRPLTKEGQWSDFIEVKKFRNFVRGKTVNRGLDKAITNFTFERLDESGLILSLLRLEPQTGRTHQLRVQCAKRNLPIVGDQTYGKFDLNKEMRRVLGIPRMFLHCFSTSIEFEFEGEKILFTAESPLPQSFNDALAYNGVAILKARGRIA